MDMQVTGAKWPTTPVSALVASTPTARTDPSKYAQLSTRLPPCVTAKCSGRASASLDHAAEEDEEEVRGRKHALGAVGSTTVAPWRTW